MPIRLELPVADKARIWTAARTRRARGAGALVPLSESRELREVPVGRTIHHKDLLPVVYVTGDMAGRLDSPLYGMFGIVAPSVGRARPRDRSSATSASPRIRTSSRLKWDGEWQITYETFRDMGLAYSVGLVLIYLLVVAQFGLLRPAADHHGTDSADHHRRHARPRAARCAVHGHVDDRHDRARRHHRAQFDPAGRFHQHGNRAGRNLEDAVVRAGAIRAKPIALTALAAMIGALFILDDPIFNGLAVSLIFGIFVSTLLTLVVIPVLYYAYLSRRQAGQ